NNILTPILGYAEIGLDCCDDNPALKEFITEIRNATLRAKDLVGQILIYARQSDDDVSPIHLIPLVKEVAKQHVALLAPAIEVRTAIRSQKDLVLANPIQIHQILTNLLTNAAYAMRETGGTLDIQLSSFSMGWRHRQEFPQLPRGTYVRLTIKDSGPGIPEEIQERIFDPFFSTKPHGEGTGMGLSVVKSIIDARAGAIAIESAPDQGATFHIALPLLQEEHVDTNTNWMPPTPSEKTVLFVDDEPAIAHMAQCMLPSIGFTTVICTTARQALAILQNPKHKIGLLVTDLVMPEQSGLELAAAAHVINPALPIVIFTGYPEKLDQTKALEVGVRAMVIKPATRNQISDVLARVLKGQTLLPSPLKKEPPHPPPQEQNDPQPDQ
ncbi:MAG: ATP-binding protein, partial [Kiritimatiellia bacterium]